jgi:hypothetical protein
MGHPEDQNRLKGCPTRHSQRWSAITVKVDFDQTGAVISMILLKKRPIFFVQIL